VARGRDADFTRYVEQRIAWLRKLSYLLCHDWHRADDLVQVTITRLYVHWRRVRAADNPDGYTRRVLVNTFLAERRSGWLSRVTLVGNAPDRAVADPDETTRLAVRAALAAVPPRQRATLVLRYYCDLSIEETAQVLGCSTGTVKSQTARGLAALRKSWPALAAPEKE
jgi:RNA polymerase sigma-70 factor (sigma-E family)